MSSRAREQNPAHATDKYFRDSVQRKVSEQNQVTPFYLDDGDDDTDNEMRRRRYSSSSSSSSLASNEADNRRPSERKKRQPHSSRERENEWDRASNHAASSSSDGDTPDDSDTDDVPSNHSYGKHSNRKVGEEPESPRQQHRRAQQSDESASESQGDEDSGKAVKPTIAVAPTAVAAPPSGKLATIAMPVDLSRISKLAVFPGSEAQLIQGHVVRVKTLLHSHYHFFIKDQLILMAEKQLQNRTSNYHIFDMTRATALNAKLTKKSGNYVGKLRSNFSKKKNVLFGNLSRKTELGAILFADHASSSEPRHLNVILPALAPKRQEIEGLTVGDSTTSFSQLIDLFQREAEEPSSRAAATLQVFENKEPVFDNGFYRLNFNGRVSMPSVKNFQLVRAGKTDGGSQDDVCLQFGKVDGKKFHLDFRAPLTPIQAFAIALAQFNL